MIENKPFEKDLIGKKVVVCFSQGIDSTTLAYYYSYRGAEVTLAYFDDGPWNVPGDTFYDPSQPVVHNHFMSEEPDYYAKWHSDWVGMKYVKIRYPQLNALHAVVPPDNDKAEHAEGLGLHFWVGYKPLMNMILMGYGSAHNQDLIVFGHLNEDTAYYDENPKPFDQLRDFMVETYQRVKIPLVDNPYCRWNFNKQDVIDLAKKVGAPLSHSYSCRRTPAIRHEDGRYIQCGVCENCLRRIEAFKIHGSRDPALYDNS